MIDQCIFEVYKRDKRVLIPDFGAIIYSEFNDEVNFNGLLDFDDGKVVNQIQKQQFLSEEKARIAMEEYIKDIRKTLDRGKSVFFGGIGYLSIDNNGTIFIQKTKPSYRSSSRSIIDEPSEEVLTSEYEHSEETAVPDNFASSIEESDFKFEDDIETEPKKRSTLKIAMLVIIPIMLIGAGGYYYFSYRTTEEARGIQDSQKSFVETQTTKNTEMGQTAEDNFTSDNSESTASDTPSAPTSLRNEPVEDNLNTYESAIGEDKIYSLVLGSFKVESNADIYQQHLLSKGIEVIKFYGGNNFYFVGYEKIKGKSNAVKLLREIKGENPAAWIINKELLQL